jgi:hypothetical protein
MVFTRRTGGGYGRPFLEECMYYFYAGTVNGQHIGGVIESDDTPDNLYRQIREEESKSRNLEVSAVEIHEFLIVSYGRIPESGVQTLQDLTEKPKEPIRGKSQHHEEKLEHETRSRKK